MTARVWNLANAVDVFPWTLTDNPYADWLLEDDWNEKKFHQWMFTNAIYPLQLYNNYLLDNRKATEYMRRNGISYLDIHDPRNLVSGESGSAMIRYGINFISSNLSKLYR